MLNRANAILVAWEQEPGGSRLCTWECSKWKVIKRLPTQPRLFQPDGEVQSEQTPYAALRGAGTCRTLPTPPTTSIYSQQVAFFVAASELFWAMTAKKSACAPFCAHPGGRQKSRPVCTRLRLQPDDEGAVGTMPLTQRILQMADDTG